MKRFARHGLFVLVLTLAFSVGFSWRDLRLGDGPSPDAFLRLVTGRIDDGPTPTQLFRDNYALILARFHRPIKPSRLKYAAMQGLFASLGDPNTVFLEPQSAENFAIETKGNYAGIGSRMSSDPLGALIATVFKNGPADTAGIKVGDIVTRVDKLEIAGMPIDQIVEHVRGGEGTPVVLHVLRRGEPGRLAITVHRAIVIVPTSEGRMLPGTDIGYIKVDQFSATTIEQFDASLFEVLQHRPEGLIIDLRGNPGGLLNVAAAMLGRFVDGKTVVTMRQKNGHRDVSSTERGATIGYGGPIIVLIDRDSASASEIFAGVMRDYKRATLVGEHTYGKASVQTTILLRDMSTAKITVARYYIPSGEEFQRKEDEDGNYVSGGIKPHYAVELDPSVEQVIGEPSKDFRLAKAVEVILQKRGS